MATAKTQVPLAKPWRALIRLAAPPISGREQKYHELERRAAPRKYPVLTNEIANPDGPDGSTSFAAA